MLEKSFRERLMVALRDREFIESYHLYRDFWKRRRDSPEQMKKNVQKMLTEFEQAKNAGKKPKYEIYLSSSKKRYAKKKIPFNEDFAFLLGTYFGNLNIKQGRMLSVTVKEKDFIDLIAKLIEKLTGKTVKIRTEKGYNTRLYTFSFHDLDLIRGLEKHTQRRKNVPIHALQEKAGLMQAFLMGLFQSGGYIISRGNSISIISRMPSLRIAEQTMLVLASFGIFPTIGLDSKGYSMQISEHTDVIYAIKLGILLEDTKKMALEKLKKVKEKRVIHSYTLDQFEKVIELKTRYLFKRAPLMEIEKETGVPRHQIKQWPKNIPFAVRKLDKLLRLSEKYNYHLPFLENFPLSLSIARRAGSKKRPAIKKSRMQRPR